MRLGESLIESAITESCEQENSNSLFFFSLEQPTYIFRNQIAVLRRFSRLIG